MAEQTKVTLRDGNVIPQIGLGVWQVDPAITERVVTDGQTRLKQGTLVRDETAKTAGTSRKVADNLAGDFGAR